MQPLFAIHILIIYLKLVKYSACLSLYKPFPSISNSSTPLLHNRPERTKFGRNTPALFINDTKAPENPGSRVKLAPEYVATVPAATMTADTELPPEDSAKFPTERAKTNLILTVSYDGGNYYGMVGPMVFLADYGIPVDFKDINVKSVSNQLMRTITLIHGYFGNKRKLRSGNEQRMRRGAEQAADLAAGPAQGSDAPPDPAEDLLKRFTMISASRTDRGVHSIGAACQYLSFDKEFNFESLEEFQDSLNKSLPDDIRVTSVVFAPTPKFNVRHNNVGKRYVYKVDLGSNPSLFERNYYWQIMSDRHFVNTLRRSKRPPDRGSEYRDAVSAFSFERLREAGKVFHGTHNFEAFRKTSRGNERGNAVDPVCTIESIEFVPRPEDKLEIVVRGNRFLYKMVRCIVGHLILAGFDVLKPAQIKLALDTATEIPNIPYAPAHGLYLDQVFFPKEIQDQIDRSRESYERRMHGLLDS